MKKVLIIDDDERPRPDLLEIFGFEGYKALGAENGHEGILSAREQLPDLIICDITMPVLDGSGVLAALCQDSQTSNIPVIFLSAHKDQTTVQKGLQLGAVAHLPKPYNLTDLLATVRAQTGD